MNNKLKTLIGTVVRQTRNSEPGMVEVRHALLGENHPGVALPIKLDRAGGRPLSC